MIYSLLLPQDYSDKNYAQLYIGLRPLLPDFRKLKADASLSAKARVSGALAYLLLCRGLQKEYSLPETIKPEFVYGTVHGTTHGTAHGTAADSGSPDSHKKPFLAPPYDNIFFSLSHCKTGIACALSGSPVGVDIQDIRRIKENAVKKFLDGFDGALTQTLVSSPSAFAALWSRYEAYVKLTGDGISRSFSDCGGLSPEFLVKNGIRITTTFLDTKKTAAYLSAAFLGYAAQSGSHTDNSDFAVECLDFSDFCHSLFSRHS